MIVTSNKTVFVPDLGDSKDKEYRKGVTLHTGVATTLPDDAVTYKSIHSGALAALVTAGDIVVGTPTTATTQNLCYAVVSAGGGGTTAFTIPGGYVTGNKSMHVYVDGVLQNKPGVGTAAYVETNSTTITMSAAQISKSMQFIRSK